MRIWKSANVGLICVVCSAKDSVDEHVQFNAPPLGCWGLSNSGLAFLNILEQPCPSWRLPNPRRRRRAHYDRKQHHAPVPVETTVYAIAAIGTGQDPLAASGHHGRYQFGPARGLVRRTAPGQNTGLPFRQALTPRCLVRQHYPAYLLHHILLHQDWDRPSKLC